MIFVILNNNLICAEHLLMKIEKLNLKIHIKNNLIYQYIHN